MAKIFVIANQKGGVGKTTTTVNLAASLHKHGQRTLLVDLDPQGNATMGSGVDKRALPRSVYQVLLGSSSVAESTHVSPSGGYSVLGANRELAGAELELVDVDRREERLKNALAAVDDLYDFVLIDCPPSLSLLTLNGFCAAHGVIIPMQCEYFALEGLSDLVNTIKKVHANFNTNLRVIGLLRVMFDPRMTLGQQVSRQLEQHFGDKVFKAVIPRNVRLAEAPSYGMPGVIYDPHSKGAKAYLEFGTEMISRLQALDAAARGAAQGTRPAPAQQAAQPRPQAVQPQVAQPQVAQPLAAQPLAAQPQVAQPQFAQPQPAQPQAADPQPLQARTEPPQAVVSNHPDPAPQPEPPRSTATPSSPYTPPTFVVPPASYAVPATPAAPVAPVSTVPFGITPAVTPVLTAAAAPGIASPRPTASHADGSVDEPPVAEPSSSSAVDPAVDDNQPVQETTVSAT